MLAAMHCRNASTAAAFRRLGLRIENVQERVAGLYPRLDPKPAENLWRPEIELTDPARAILIGARDRADEAGQAHVTTRHVALGLADDQGVAGVLRDFDTTPEQLRTALADVIDTDEAPVREGVRFSV